MTQGAVLPGAGAHAESCYLRGAVDRLKAGILGDRDARSMSLLAMADAARVRDGFEFALDDAIWKDVHEPHFDDPVGFLRREAGDFEVDNDEACERHARLGRISTSSGLVRRAC